MDMNHNLSRRAHRFLCKVLKVKALIPLPLIVFLLTVFSLLYAVCSCLVVLQACSDPPREQCTKFWYCSLCRLKWAGQKWVWPKIHTHHHIRCPTGWWSILPNVSLLLKCLTVHIVMRCACKSLLLYFSWWTVSYLSIPHPDHPTPMLLGLSLSNLLVWYIRNCAMPRPGLSLSRCVSWEAAAELPQS